MSRARKAVLWAGIALALYAALGFLVAPPIARSQAERALVELLGRQVTLERVRINPFALSASIHGFTLKEPDGSTVAASFEELYANLALSSLLRFGAVVEEVRLVRPHVRVARHEDGRYSFQDILERFANAPPAPPGPSPRFAVTNVTVSGGRIDVDDRQQKARHAVTDLELGLPFVSSLPQQVDLSVQPRLSLKVNGTPFAIAGETKPFKDTHETVIRFDIDDLPLARYLAYSPVPLGVRVPSGRLDTRLALSFTLGPDNRLRTLNLSGTASLQDLRVQQPDGAPLVAFGQLAVHIGTLDLLGRRALVNAVRLDKPELDLVRGKDGRLNLLAALPAPAGQAPAAQDGPPFAFSIAEVAVTGGALRFSDQVPEKPVRFALDQVSLRVSGLGNAPEAKAALKFSAGAGTGARLGYEGDLRLAPPATEGTLEVAGLPLRTFAPYVEELLNVIVTGGAFSTKGRLAVEAAEGAPLRLAYRADASVANFASLDKPTAQDLLRWKSLAVTGIDFELEPLKVALAEVALTDYFSRLIVNADGTLNLQSLRRVPAAAPQPPPAAAPSAGLPPNIRLGRITLRGGSVNFSDYFVKPNYTVLLTGVGGGVSEMTAAKAGEVELRGRIHQTAPVEIAGRVNPLAGELFLDLKASARDIELSPMSPYAVKYAGYGIEKGKLSVKVAYRVENRKLAAQNNVYLDQLTFGAPVESPTATKLPVQLAIALLKDRNGVIDIDLPISGSLDDPEFSLGGIIVRVFVNLIVKAVTSPFALLGAMFGGGEELAYLEFAPGAARLDAGGEAKLKALARALEERPGLKLDVSGRIAPDADREALRRAALDRQVKAAKLRDAGTKPSATASLDEVSLDPQEYGKYLAAAYRAAKFDRPRNALGVLLDLPAAEMEKLLLQHTQVSDDDLRVLANARAQVAKEWLVGTGKIAAERIFIVTPSSGAEGLKDKGSPTRADFALK